MGVTPECHSWSDNSKRKKAAQPVFRASNVPSAVTVCVGLWPEQDRDAVVANCMILMGEITETGTDRLSNPKIARLRMLPARSCYFAKRGMACTFSSCGGQQAT